MKKVERMDVDSTDESVPKEGTSGASASTLKRSCSAPMIDQIEAGGGAGSAPPAADSGGVLRSPALGLIASSPTSSTNYWRSRRLSANYGSLSSPSSPHGVAPRVQQLKQEEGVDETRHESTLNTGIKLSLSWNDLTVGDEGRSVPSISDPLTVNLGPWNAPSLPSPVAPQSLSSSSSSSSQAPLLHVAHHQHLIPPYSSPLPSPTRGTRFAAQPPMRSVSFSPSPSPSPTRKTFTTRRSQSPIAMRASQLLIGSLGMGVKRKCDLDPGECSSSSEPSSCSPPAPKRLFGAPSGLLMPQPHASMSMDPPSPIMSRALGMSPRVVPSSSSSTTSVSFDTPPPSVGSSEGPGVAQKSNPATPSSLAKAMEEVMVTSEMNQGQ